MLKITCSTCNHDAVVNPYLYSPDITTHILPNDAKEYIAHVMANIICPECGKFIHKTFSCPIFNSDIIDLALRQEGIICDYGTRA